MALNTPIGVGEYGPLARRERAKARLGSSVRLIVDKQGFLADL